MERLAWCSSMKFERGVVCEKGTVKKSPFFLQQLLLVENGRLT